MVNELFRQLAELKTEIERRYQESGIAILEAQAAAVEKQIKAETTRTQVKYSGSGYVCQLQRSYECKGEPCAELTTYAARFPELNRELLGYYHRTQYIESKALRCAMAMFPEHRPVLERFITLKTAVVLRKGTVREQDDDEEVPF